MFAKVDQDLSSMIQDATEKMVLQNEAFSATKKMVKMKIADMNASKSKDQTAQNFNLFGNSS